MERRETSIAERKHFERREALTCSWPCRSMLTSLSILTSLHLALGMAQPALAKDLKEAQAEKEARKKALRAAAGEIKTTGKDVAQVRG